MASDSNSIAREYRDALYEALAGASGVRDADPILVLERLTEAAAPLVEPGSAPGETLGRLREVADAGNVDTAVDRAMEHFLAPDAFREAIYFARCLERDAGSALGLQEGRFYLEGATVPLAFADLLTDRDAVRDATTFALLWREPARADWMTNAINIWKREYASIYIQQHAAYRTAISTIADRIDGIEAKAAAVERLNNLRRLGPQVAGPALAQLGELARLYPCDITASDLSEALNGAPACPECAFALGQPVPIADTRRVVQAVERGLATQQARLARRVVSRVIARPALDEDEKLDRFIRTVQASDLTGLALILDDELVELVRDLLGPAADDGDVLRLLSLNVPEVTESNLDAAVAEFRRLVSDEIDRTGRAVLRRIGS